MKLGMGKHEDCNYAYASTVQPSTINHQHLPSLQDGGSLHIHKNLKELPQTLTRNSQSQSKCANPSGAQLASNHIYYIQLPRDMHKMSSNGAYP